MSARTELTIKLKLILFEPQSARNAKETNRATYVTTVKSFICSLREFSLEKSIKVPFYNYILYCYGNLCKSVAETINYLDLVYISLMILAC